MTNPTGRATGLMAIVGSVQLEWRELAHKSPECHDTQHGCVPLCRVPQGTYFYIKRALDAGAWGIVVPMVDTVEEATIAIRAAKYPPQGNRSLGGGLQALNFDTSNAEYFRRANDEILIVLQTESAVGQV